MIGEAKLLTKRGRAALTVRWLLALFALLVLLGAILLSHRQSVRREILVADPETLLSQAALRDTVLDGGRSVYMRRCASCHGAAGQGDRSLGVPDLTDADHLYGDGKVAEIEDIARYGIRAGNKRGWNLAVMPAYGSAVPDKAEPLPPQTPAQVEDLTQFLLSFTGRASDRSAAERGRTLFQHGAGCWDCHSYDAGGDAAIGAPTLSDGVWLYGGSHEDIYRSIASGRAGFSPAFGRILSAIELREVAFYIASLAPKGGNR
ncbi:MAG: c-type cytochrome [Sphingomonas bacterium]|nr:c-type cytochrome [Sphingomonas bacterium]